MEAYLGQIILFAGNYVPQGWAYCNGDLLPINGNEALYSLIGVTYGGNGTTNFALPDLRGRVPFSYGQGVAHGTAAPTTNHTLGTFGGVEMVALTTAMIPPHTHPLVATTAGATTGTPTGQMLAQTPTGDVFYFDPAKVPAGVTITTATLGDSAVMAVGGNQPHSNMMPSAVISYLICIQGQYPLQPQS